MMAGAQDQRIPALDGLRAIAILSVMACHLFGYSMRDRQWSLLPRIVAAITAPGLSADYYRPFYVRRFWRIVPLYVGE